MKNRLILMLWTKNKYLELIKQIEKAENTAKYY